ncbi:hypothetical protein CDL12_21217 [Handroanthus impetiginosus]|uniref:PUM-HD domain-containing protein n=1 Tax=Handroanthus impetiginosus TaxID=429701 RepID=A0A2G9GLS4_9LAMI|nr:hypothetical protein CDL12_21217 [Handroanthus impetiginosus]
MAYSDSQVPAQGQNSCPLNVDVEDVNVLSFRSSGFKKNKKYSVLSSSPILELEEDENHQWFHDDQETLIESQNLADDYKRLFWAYRHFKTFDNSTSDCCPEISSQSTTSFGNGDIHPRQSHMGLYGFDNSENRDIMNCSCNKSDAKNNDMMISCCERGSEEDCSQKERAFRDYVLLLAKACEDHSLVETVLLETELFIDAAFRKQGASSIIKLIKKLKVEKSHHAFTVTRILSTRFLDMTTHPIARIVIQKCLFFFGSQPNKIMYEKAMHHLDVLAIHEVGCRSLNDCIDTISGEQRAWLLNQIADVSDYLSNHPYGVLGLKDSQVNTRILKCLRGQFIHLAQKKEGSHVVEKCMESCDLGVPGFGHINFALVRSLEPHCKELNRTRGGKNVIRLIEKACSV